MKNRYPVFSILHEREGFLTGTNCVNDTHTINIENEYYEVPIGLVLLYKVDSNISTVKATSDNVKYGSDLILANEFIIPVRKSGIWSDIKIKENKHIYQVYFDFLQKQFDAEKLYVISPKLEIEKTQLDLF